MSVYKYLLGQPLQQYAAPAAFDKHMCNHLCKSASQTIETLMDSFTPPIAAHRQPGSQKCLTSPHPRRVDWVLMLSRKDVGFLVPVQGKRLKGKAEAD